MIEISKISEALSTPIPAAIAPPKHDLPPVDNLKRLVSDLESVVSSHKLEREDIDARAVELERQASDLRKSGHGINEQLEVMLKDVQKQRLAYMECLRDEILEWCSGYSPMQDNALFKAAQLTTELRLNARTFEGCVNFGGDSLSSGRFSLYNGIGEVAVALMACGKLVNTVPNLVPKIADMKPYRVYMLATKLGLGCEAMVNAKACVELSERIQFELLANTYARAPIDDNKGRYINNLSREDFILTFGNESFITTYKEGLSDPERAETFRGFKNAADYKIWRTTNAVIL